jgi:hypothetical protein
MLALRFKKNPYKIINSSKDKRKKEGPALSDSDDSALTERTTTTTKKIGVPRSRLSAALYTALKLLYYLNEYL